jgi:hypothetical protein
MLVAGDSLDVNVMAAYRTSAGRAFRAVIDSYAVWSSAVSNVAVINGGRLHAVSEGKTQIMAFFDGMADTMEVTVLQKPVFVKRINFQATSTPFRDGWLADNGALYSVVKGYGWSGSGTLIKADTRKGDNFLFKSLVITSAPRVYILDVPDGEYQIRIGMGDNVYGINNAAWTLIGSDTICMKLPFHENVVATTSAVVVAGGTGLRLTVNGAINYIVVCSSSEGVPIDLVADDGYYSGSTNVLNRNTDREIVSLDAFPNPFNPSTLIRFSLPGGESHDVRILLFSASGRLIRELIPVKNRKDAQQLLWDGRDNHGRTVASGQYVAVLTNSKYHVRKRLLLIR